MALSNVTLHTELLNMVPVATEAESASALTDAYAVYAAGATANGVPLTSAGIVLGQAAMLSALSGMSSPNQGANRLRSGFNAFWTAIAGAAAVSFPGSTLVTPPPFSALEGLLASTFSTNTSGELSLSTALQNVANAIHAATLTGGTATFPGPVVSPIL